MAATPITDNKTNNRDDAFAGFDFEATTDRVREFSEQLLGSWKQQGVAALDAYESAVDSMLDLEMQIADTLQLEWVTALTDAHVDLVTSIADAYTSVAREVLEK